jgi:hypothetical protein
MGLENVPPELLEAILLGVGDEKTVLLAQRVCRRWADCIRQSSAIQQDLFFQPANPILPGCQIPRQNPLLAAKFPYWFPDDNIKSCAMAYGAGDMQDFLDRRKKYLGPKASWRRMLVQQPPVLTLQWIDRSLSFDNRITLQRYKLPLGNCGDGLRMSTLFDLVVRSAEEAEQFFHFRIVWGHYQTFSKQFDISYNSNPDPCEINDSQYRAAFESANLETNIVFDTWHTEHMPCELSDSFGQDTWTWDLIRGLKSPIGDLDLDELLERKSLEQVTSWLKWSVTIPCEGYMNQTDTCEGYFFPLDEYDSDL